MNGKVTDENALRATIYQMLETFLVTGLSKKVDDIMKDLRIKAQVRELPPQTNRIHLKNGTLFLDGTFVEDKNEIVRCRFPVNYNPNAKPPERWLKFLSELFYPEDIPSLQEFIGYCLIPSNAGQKMMIIKGSGGEGKSQIGNALFHLFGANAKDGSVGKVSENPFARADLEHALLMIDDDMRLEALKQTNYVKSIVNIRGKMDLERKGKQSYQGFMYARILAFSNGDLISLYDRSDGFFRRQLILTTKHKPADRIDDPELSVKLCEELEGIFLWAFEGLQRLVKNCFQFTESDRARMNREMVKKDANNIELFMESQGYISRGENLTISSKELAQIYFTWCDENAFPAMKGKTLIEYREAYFVPDKRSMQQIFSYKPRPGAEDEIYRKIGDITISMRATDHLKMPECIMNRVQVGMSEDEQQVYDQMKEQLIVQVKGKEIDAVNAAALSGKLCQMANGAVYTEEKDTVQIHDRKLDALEDLIEGANGKPLLVAYWFKHDLKRIQEHFPAAREIRTSKDIADWNDGRIPLAVIHPASAGHGLNLQAGGSTLVWFGLTWSLELYQQTNARLWRQGQTSSTVVIHHIMTKGTIDVQIMQALERKDKTQSALIDAVKAQLGGTR